MQKFYTLFLVFACFVAPAQNINETIAGLKKQLAENPDAAKRAQLHADLAWYYASVSIDSANVYGKMALAEAQKLGNMPFLGQVYSDMGAISFRNNDYANAENFFLKSYAIRSELRDIKGIAKINNNLANVYKSTGQPKKAAKMYLEALDFFEKNAEQDNINITKGNLGTVFRDMKDYKLAEKYLVECVAYFEGQNNGMRLCENYTNLGSVYQQEKKFEKALLNYNKANEKCTSIGNVKAASYITRNLGVLYREQKKDSASQAKFSESEGLRKQFNSKMDLANIEIENASNKIQNEKYAEAEARLLKSKTLYEPKKDDKNLMEIYRNLAIAKTYLGQADSANFYFDKYIDTQNRTQQLSIIRQTQELNTKYESEKKDRELQEHKNKLFRRNVMNFSLLAALLAGLGVAISLFRHRKKNEKIQLQKEILHQQDLAAKAVMDAEDNERKRMAVHLHDGVGQMLTATNMNLMALEDYKDDAPTFDLVVEKTKNILKDAIDEVRTLSHQIMPNMLIRNSLSNALKELIDKNNSPKLHMNLKMEGLQDSLDENIQVVMFRVIQECINNTIKHAKATEISIEVKQTPTEISASFADNGIGFDPKKNASRSDGMGLDNIRTRIEFLKGIYQLRSEAGKGTKIYIEIPLA